MNTALAIAGREVRDKVRLFLVAAVLAVLPFLATLLPTSRGWDQRMIVGMFGGTLAVGLGLGLAIALGAATIGRELSDRRLSFYFSKPVSPAAIWFGKAGASLFTALACFAIVGIPALLVSRSAWGATWTLSQSALAGVVAIAAVALFLISHALSTMIRSRSSLIAVDLILLAVMFYGVISLVRPLIAGQAMELTGTLLLVLGALLLVILAVGPVWQLAKGRTDVRRNHVALSRVVWPALLVVFLGAAAYVAWVVHPSPSDMTRASATQTPGGEWMFVGGDAKYRGDYNASMLINTTDGRSLRTAMPWTGPAFSRDGQVLAWLAAASYLPWSDRGLELQLAHLKGEPRVTSVDLRTGNTFVLSDDGSRFAGIYRGTISVHDLQGDRLLASAQGLTDRSVQEMIFVSPDVVRIWQHDPAALTIWELDVTRKRLTKVGQTEEKVPFRGLSANADASRLLLHGSGKVVDGRTGALLYQVPVGASRRGSSMLNDGTVVVTDAKAGRVSVFLPGGAPGAAVALPQPADYVAVGNEIAGGKVVLLLQHAPGKYGAAVVDLKRGVVERSDNVRSWAPGWFAVDPRLTVLAANAPLAVMDGDHLALWDWKTGAKKQM